MKKALILAFVCCLPAAAQSPRPYEFELTPGCMWNKSQGTCVITNRHKTPITCKVAVRGKTFNQLKVGSTRIVVINAGEFNNSAKVFSPPEDLLTYVSATADCTMNK